MSRNAARFHADKTGMFEWNSNCSVGIVSIDAQHQNLFAIARELHAAMSSGLGKAKLARTLDRLVQYTSVHFAHEERLMRLHDYPELAEHAAEHQALTEQVMKFQRDFQSGRTLLTIEILQFLRDWLVKHIQRSDTRYAPYLKQHSVV
jgi:hemerythrin-like metal-binding protein